jgi:hypothetical protein
MFAELAKRIDRLLHRIEVAIDRWAGLGPPCQSEDGTMAQVTIIVVMGFTILVGLVGNVGLIVQKKVAVQNAADSVAYSTALWEARSMNAVTAINHLMGEVTAICVLHEALGGPELDEGKEQKSDEFKNLNKKIKDFRPVDEVAIIIPGLQEIDEQIVEQVRKIVTYNEGDDGTTTAGATLYDSRITLKQLVAFFQDVKVLGNILIALGDVPSLEFLIPIGVGLHAVATPPLIKCGIEAGLLIVVEGGAKVFITPKRLLERQVLPLLARYSDTLVKPGALASGPLATSIQATIKELESRHSVEANVFPTPSNIKLPLIPEPAPKDTQGQTIRSKSVESGWPGVIEQTFNAISSAGEVVNFFNSAVDSIPGATEITGFFTPNLPPMENDGAPKNFSRESLKKLPADWQTEEKTQWVRATYPWVDALRAPIISGMKSPLALQFSKAGVWYGHWTNRFTLAKSYSYRSGKPLLQGGQTREKLKMYIMNDMQPDRKGKEKWTTNSQEAERLFTVMGLATHRVDIVFSPVIFGTASHDQVVYAQAMYYNANPQLPGNSGQRQPKIGWDTLNWQPPVDVPEYGTVPTERGSLWPPWEIFQRKAQSNTPAIKLNWQAKLVPVTQRRLGQSATGLGYHDNIREGILKAVVNTKRLDTH